MESNDEIKISVMECCDNCSFVMKQGKKWKCIIENAWTFPHYVCGKFISKVTLLNDKKESKI